jgi:3-hydroxymyristoyl/3-hydroxydecanoyl-(acyl carrier protein) dehydratase
MNHIIEQISASSLGTAEQTDQGWESAYLFGSDFTGFDGHFPTTPILPAIIQIMLVRHAIAQQMQKQLQVTQIARTKFIKSITPGIPVKVIWNVTEQDECLKCKCRLQIQDETASSISMTLKAETH